MQQVCALMTKYGCFGSTQKVKLKRCTYFREISVRQNILIALGKDSANAAQTIARVRRLT
jgi:hypothetical protein